MIEYNGRKWWKESDTKVQILGHLINGRSGRVIRISAACMHACIFLGWLDHSRVAVRSQEANSNLSCRGYIDGLVGRPPNEIERSEFHVNEFVECTVTFTLSTLSCDLCQCHVSMVRFRSWALGTSAGKLAIGPPKTLITVLKILSDKFSKFWRNSSYSTF